MLDTATRARPAAIRYPRGNILGVSPQPEWRELPWGKGEVLRRGQDVTLAIGSLVYPSLEAAQQLAEEGVKCTVVDARFVKPLDKELIISTAERAQRVVTVEENALAGGLGCAVLQLLASARRQNIKVECLGLPDEFMEHGSQSLLRSLYNLDVAGIAPRIHQAFSELFLPEPLLSQRREK